MYKDYFVDIINIEKENGTVYLYINILTDCLDIRKEKC
jgi:hypothetical protein